MLSIRSCARTAPRAVVRSSITSARTESARSFSTRSAFKSTPRTSALSTSARPVSSVSQFAFKSLRAQSACAFSTSTPRRAKAAEHDDELIAKLDSEIQMENEMKDEGGIPTSVTDYLENGPFEIVDVPGQEDVILTRTFGDEKIRITFSIADLNSIDPESDYADRAMGDEEDGGKPANEDGEEGAEGEEDQDTSFPARLNIVIEKASKGAMAVEAVVQDGMVVIDNVYYYSDVAHAQAKTAEKVHERQDLYVGPPFGNLDEDLQVMLERYLDERGINTALAIFVPDYIDMKEQKEYVRWLENVKGFVEA